ncbi:MAG: cytochrome c3 family protein [Phycisphaerales bacterium]|nr:cytochrome c3 family protein [Phycisphaerales bacterium]
MSLLFPKWTNALPTVGAIAALLGASGVVGGFWYYATPKFYDAGYMPTQPGGGFSHQIHAGKLGMDCRYCHTKVEQSPEANIPNVATCIGCHADGRLTKLAVEPKHKERTDFIRQAYNANQSIEWRRIHKLPDYVRNFPHATHIRAGVSCYSCHGQIDAMPIVAQAQPLSMGWCLDCHRNPEASLVSPDKVTQLEWVKKHLDERGGQGDAETKALVEKLKLNPPENCGACHY